MSLLSGALLTIGMVLKIVALLAGSSDICDHEGCFGLYNLNLVLFNKAWFIEKKILYIYIYNGWFDHMPKISLCNF